LLSLYSVMAHAELVKVDTTFGANTGLLDTATQLVWLDLTVTNDQSFDYVNSQLGTGGVYSGWNWATVDPTTSTCGNSQLTQLFEDNFGGCGGSSDATAILNFMNLLGGPLQAVPGYTGYIGFANVPYPYQSGWSSLYGALVIEPTVNYALGTPEFSGGAVSADAFLGTGSWLVQNAVPEPGDTGLVGLGCLVLLVVAWKSRGSQIGG
jgi:hypothetical protein